MWLEYLVLAVKGGLSLDRLRSEIPSLMRYLCDSPRKRRRRTLRQQLPALAARMNQLS